MLLWRKRKGGKLKRNRGGEQKKLDGEKRLGGRLKRKPA